jgi:hypothetical protein
MSRRQRLCGIAIALTLMFGPTIGVADTERGDTLSVRPFAYVPSLDTTPVEVHMQGIRWRVPRNFLESAQFYDRSEDPPRRLNSVGLRIVTTLSTLKGATPETMPCYKALRAEVCPDTIIMLTQWLEPSANLWNRPAIAEAARDPRDDLFGLTKVNTKLGLGQPQDAYVFYGNSFENSTVILCRRRTTQELLQDCTVRLEISGVPMRYSFAISQLPHWRRVHDGVVSIVKLFETKDAK